MKVLVTGSSGFVGGYVSEWLSGEGFDTRAMVRAGGGSSLLDGFGVSVVYGDVNEKKSLKEAFFGVDVVVHAAGVLGEWGRPERYYAKVNVEGTRNVVDACVEDAVGRLVFIGSAGVLGPNVRDAGESLPYAPSNAYERSKAEAEKIVLNAFREDGLPVVVLRPEFLYGPRDVHVLGLFKSIKKGLFPLIGGGLSLLHPTYIADLKVPLLNSIKKEAAAGETYLVTGERPVTVKEFSSLIADALGVSRPRLYLPSALAMAAALLCESIAKLSGLNPPLTKSRVLFFTQDRGFDSSKAKREIGLNPAPLAYGIKETVKWYEKNGFI